MGAGLNDTAWLEAQQALKAVVGEGGWISNPGDTDPYVRDWRGLFKGQTPLVLRPRDVAQVSEIVKIANRYGVPLVPQGGNTGLVRGGVPDASGRMVVVSLQRLNRIRAVDADDFSLVAEAGAILADVQAAAESVDRLFPLSLGSEGSARIGGLVSTNAGGIHVLRYGTMRALVLGIEAVLPTGEVFHGLTPLRKDNTGYDLKQLFIGAEGTLGIVTAVTLKLFPRLRDAVTAWMTLRSARDAVKLLALLRRATGDQVNAFELIPRDGLDLVLKHFPDVRDPVPGNAPWVVLSEVASARAGGTVRADVEAALAEALEQGLIENAVLAETEAQASALWRIREILPEAEKLDGVAVKHDVSVPVAQMPAFIEEATPVVEAMVPGSRVLAFGHLGDGNIHFNLLQPPEMDREAFLAEWHAVSARVHDMVLQYGGSISAEHGIGSLKRDELARTADPAKMLAMRAIKAALDPIGVLNPGRVL